MGHEDSECRRRGEGAASAPAGGGARSGQVGMDGGLNLCWHHPRPRLQVMAQCGRVSMRCRLVFLLQLRGVASHPTPEAGVSGV